MVVSLSLPYPTDLLVYFVQENILRYNFVTRITFFGVRLTFQCRYDILILDQHSDVQLTMLDLTNIQGPS